MLDALAQFRSRGEPMSLVLVGSDKGQLERVRATDRASAAWAMRSTMLGYRRRGRAVGLYQHAHALIYLSRFGPENLPPLEALALGCPAIVADVPGAAEQLGDAALIVDPDDPDAVADAIEQVGRPNERKRLVEAGRARAGSWTADDYLRGLLAFLDDFERERRLWA